MIGRKTALRNKKTKAGYINVSLPELTALDFFAYNHKFGINRIITILQELAEEMKPTTLAKVAKKYSNTSALQRLGYVLENVLFQAKLAEHLHRALSQRNYFTIPLSAQKEKKGETDSKWKVIKNMEIDSDL